MPKTVDETRHLELAEDFHEFTKPEFHCESFEYHKLLPRPIQRTLQKCYSRTALAVRGRSDTVVISPTLVFLAEFKTAMNPKYGRASIEALPLGRHLHEAKIGIECLYCIRHHRQGDRGFWVSDHPPLGRPWVDPGCRPEVLEQVVDMFGEYRTKKLSRNWGIDDPYFLIEEDHIADMKDWRTLIEERL